MKTILRIIAIPIRLILLLIQGITFLILAFISFLDIIVGKINDYMVSKKI